MGSIPAEGSANDPRARCSGIVRAESNAGAMLREHAQPRDGAQPEASDGEPRGEGDSCRGYEIRCFSTLTRGPLHRGSIIEA